MHSNDLHNTDDQRKSALDESAIGSPSDPLSDSPPDGTWGERDVGAPLDPVRSMADYEALRRELTSLSASHSRPNAGMRRLSSAARLGLGKTESARKT